MFQAAELGQVVSSREYKQREPDLWHALLTQQQRMRAQGAAPVLIDFAGVRGAGKSECANLLNKWMDARWIRTHGFGEATEAEAMRPIMWRYWMRLPHRQQIGIYLSGRYSLPLLDFVHERITQDEFESQLKQINSFEKTLADDGALILKYWMHIGRDVQKERLERIEQDPVNHWRVTETDWQHWKMYDRFIEVAEQIIARTNTGHAPWEIVEGADPNYRGLRVGESLCEHLDRHLTRIDIKQRYEAELGDQLGNGSSQETNGNSPGSRTVFDALDLNVKLARDDYQRQRKEYQAGLSRLQHLALEQKQTTILVFEGPDAGGKGGSIRSITNALDARFFDVRPFAAPTDEELAHQFLWRFWRCLPRTGHMTVFDRSWYGRVLVERVEGFASDDEWRRAYGEINDFENQLTQHGILLLKFWMQVDKEEQLARFQAREKTPHKQWKQTDEDWRNRKRWDDYQLAAHDVIKLTDTQKAPWILVEGNNKPHARVKVLKHVYEQLASALGEPVS